MRGSFRYPYICRLMGAGGLICLLSVPGLGKTFQKWNRKLNFKAYLISNDWLLVDSGEPPGDDPLIFNQYQWNQFNHFDLFSGNLNSLDFFILVHLHILLFDIFTLLAIFISPWWALIKEYFIFDGSKIVGILISSSIMEFMKKFNGIEFLLKFFKFGNFGVLKFCLFCCLVLFFCFFLFEFLICFFYF